MTDDLSMSRDALPTDAPPAFHLLAKPSGSTCNIDCTYCFFLSKEALYPNEKSRMSDATPQRRQELAWQSLCQAVLASNEFVYLQ